MPPLGLPALQRSNGWSYELALKQQDLWIRVSQPWSPWRNRLLPWLNVAVTLSACPQPRAAGVLGASVPLCTYTP